MDEWGSSTLPASIQNNNLALIFYQLRLRGGLVLVPDPKPTPVRIAFSIARALYWKRYTRRMRSGDETRGGGGGLEAY